MVKEALQNYTNCIIASNNEEILLKFKDICVPSFNFSEDEEGLVYLKDYLISLISEKNLAERLNEDFYTTSN